MLLVIDVGNTNIVLGVFQGKSLRFDCRFATDKGKTSDEYGMLFHQIFSFNHIQVNEIEAIIMSSVVPNLMHTLPVACEKYIGRKPLVVGSDTYTGIQNLYKNPGEVGADRIVNAAAGYYKYGGPLIIIDIGTAITLDVVDQSGNYLGGAIAPGLGISSKALFLRTAKLPKVELKKPDRAIGKTTLESIQSGMVNGFIGLIDYLTECILAELKVAVDKVKVIGTGGYSQLISMNSRYIQILDKKLTLEGLRLIYEINQESNYERAGNRSS